MGDAHARTTSAAKADDNPTMMTEAEYRQGIDSTRITVDDCVELIALAATMRAR